MEKHKNEIKIEIQGRMIGGCLDCIKMFFGTKYDKINQYINTYKMMELFGI